MNRYVLDLDAPALSPAIVGGKGARLGELAQIDGVSVPPGFCVTTDAFRRCVPLGLGDLSPALARAAVEAIAMPGDVVEAITGALRTCGAGDAYAVRSSAVAEDLRSASFAGLYDSYLNVVGVDAVLEHVRRCWGSLFTDRAVTYRARDSGASPAPEMAVVVQRMVSPDAAGVVFTADPVTSNRKVASVEACFGLGEALVSGRVNADVYSVRDGRVVTRTIATKRVAVRASAEGGTSYGALELDRQTAPVLTDEQAVRVAALARRIEAHFGSPQDVEWCLAGDEFEIVQSRPITTLFPIPASEDGRTHVYLSVGHQQMMTDAMRPLGWSMWQLTALRPMYEAGSRLFVDVTDNLASPEGRSALLAMLATNDPLSHDALITLVGPPIPRSGAESPGAGLLGAEPGIVTDLMQHTAASVAALERDIAGLSGPDLFDFIVGDVPQLQRQLFDPQNRMAIMAAMESTWWLNDRLAEWLGEHDAVDALAQSAPFNITAEMGLALLEVADAVRPHPDVVALLEQRPGDGFVDLLPGIAGGEEAHGAIRSFLDRYGMRCSGEIDITNPRWSERPTTLIPLILANVRNFEPGEAGRRAAQGRAAAALKEQEVLDRLRALPDGEHKAVQVKEMIDRLRTFIGYREYPKYGMICRYFVYKRALMAEAERLVAAGVLRAPEDAFFLTFHELHDAARTRRVEAGLVDRRTDEFRSHRALTPPRVMTSDGEVVTGSYRREDLPPGALPGLAVSAGTVEGRAIVATDIAAAEVEPGDILVTAFTDPSWTPLFLAVAGLVTEVGGLMTHGAVIAREYGLPAVVAVERATKVIRSGQRVRVNGTLGYVELLP